MCLCVFVALKPLYLCGYMAKEVPFIKEGKKYKNPVPTRLGSFKDGPKILKRYFTSDSKIRKPSKEVPVLKVDKSVFAAAPSDDIVVYWLGHAALLLEMGGRRYLIDPMLGERASMYTWAGPKRLHPSPLDMNEIGHVDAIAISHDHYDHLDLPTMKALLKSEVKFFVPFGVKAHFLRWGFQSERITEFGWWQSVADGPNTLTATPARHFSGRGLFDRDTTLWCGWAFVNEKHKVYFCGDSGIMPGFEDIGNKFCGFDLTLMPIGAYDPLWHDIHTNAPEALEAHIMLKGKKMLPIHWATFDMSLHPWAEPIEQLLIAAEKHSVDLVLPKVGERVELRKEYKEKWWR